MSILSLLSLICVLIWNLHLLLRLPSDCLLDIILVLSEAFYYHHT